MLAAYSEENVAAFLAWITERHRHCGGVTEIRILSGGKVHCGWYDADHQRELLEAIRPVERQKVPYGEHPRIGEANIYFTMQVVNPDLLARRANRVDLAKTGEATSDADILAYTIFAVDIDPKRIAGVSATAKEKRATYAVKEKVKEWFAEHGIRCIEADSGNGYHLLIPTITYTGGAAVTASEKAHLLLSLLAEKFNTDAVEVDTTISNLSRILKLYGSKAVKGDHTESRPHRWSGIDLSNIPPDIDLFAVLQDELDAFSAKQARATGNVRQADERPSPARSNPTWSPQDSINVLEHVLRAEGVNFRRKTKGGREVFEFERCPVHTDDDGHSFECCVMVEADGQFSARCQHDDARHWQPDFKAAIGWDKHIQEAKRRLGLVSRGQRRTSSEHTDEPPTYTPLIVRVTRQGMKRVRWLVQSHFPLGKLSIVAGLPGTSKSLLSIYLIAGMQGKVNLPHLAAGVPANIIPGDALLVTCEDDPEDTIAPRIAAYGVDPASVPIHRGTRIVEPDGSESLSLFDLTAHLPTLDGFLVDNPNTRLLVLDPVQTFLGRTDLNHNTQVNQVLTELGNLAQKRNVAVLVISHFNKKSDQSAMDRVIGSRGFSGTVRAMWVVTPDPETKGRFIMSCVKMQNAAKPDAMAYTIQTRLVFVEGAEEYIPVLEFEPDRQDINPDDLVQSSRVKSEGSKKDRCAKWIEDTLRQWGGPMELRVLRGRAVEQFSNDTFHAAKRELDLPEVKVTTQSRCWLKFVALKPQDFETEGWRKLEANIKAGRLRRTEADATSFADMTQERCSDAE